MVSPLVDRGPRCAERTREARRVPRDRPTGDARCGQLGEFAGVRMAVSTRAWTAGPVAPSEPARRAGPGGTDRRVQRRAVSWPSFRVVDVQCGQRFVSDGHVWPSI